jgi:hypothetical protein
VNLKWLVLVKIWLCQNLFFSIRSLFSSPSWPSLSPPHPPRTRLPSRSATCLPPTLATLAILATTAPSPLPGPGTDTRDTPPTLAGTDSPTTPTPDSPPGVSPLLGLPPSPPLPGVLPWASPLLPLLPPRSLLPSSPQPVPLSLVRNDVFWFWEYVKYLNFGRTFCTFGFVLNKLPLKENFLL